MSWIDTAIGPRKIGGRYRCGYWAAEYTVTDIRIGKANGWSQWEIAVEWADGHTGRHSTAWDAKRDRVISQP